MIIILKLILALSLLQNTQEPSRELRAAMFLGSRSAQIEQKLPVLNQVVLVPDEATYLDEISRWSTQQRWPVLFQKEPFVSQFIRRFNPEQCWVRESVGQANANKKDIKIEMTRTVAQAWDGTASIEIAFTDLGMPPTGVVITSEDDYARTAAVALAAGRGQLLLFLQSGWGECRDILNQTQTNSLLQEINSLLQSTGVQYAELGDTIDAITLCQTMPARVEFTRPHDNPVAITDVIGRNKEGKRFAWTGWIFGTKPNAAYVAMCSLFLDRDQYWFCNTYPNSGNWANYGLENIPSLLPQFGIDFEVVDGTLRGLQEAEAGGVTTDVAYFMSKGNADFLDMSDERTAPTWLPILNTPSALYFLHSWSLKNPSGKSTVGGTWLSRGVYAYIGSSHEPMLSAFIQPTQMLRKTMSLIPFLVAARWQEGEHMFSKPWRVNTIGDPLMLCPPNSSPKRERLAPQRRSGYTSAKTLAQQAMRKTTESPNDDSFANAVRSVILLGEDSMANGVWEAATSKGFAGPSTAHAVLPALFRLQKQDAFLWAFSLIDTPTKLEQDMLWQLSGLNDGTPLQVLINNLRRPYEVDDLMVIKKRIVSTRGAKALKDIIDEKLKKASGRNKRELQRMRKEYGG